MHEALIEYLRELTVTQGSQVGNKFTVLPWQRRFIKGAFDESVSEAALSMARGAGKTTFMAGIALAHLEADGIAQPGSEIVLVASTLAQAEIAFRHCVRFLDQLGRTGFKINEAQNRQTIRAPNKSILHAIGSNPKSAHGMAVHLCLADEIAQWQANKSEAMLSVLRTSLGKVPGSRLVGIGTRGSSGIDLWAETLREADFSQVFAAGKDDPPFQLRTWQKACPSLRSREMFPDLEKAYRAEAKRAKRSARVMQSFRALRLNQGVSETLQNYLIEPLQWTNAEFNGKPVINEGYILGLDLGQTTAMSAAAAYDQATGMIDAFACFPRIPGLPDREKRDAVGGLYRRMESRGELYVRGDHVVPVRDLLDLVLKRWGRPSVIAADRYHIGYLRDGLQSVGFPWAKISERGQGFKDGAEDVRRFREMILDGHAKAPVSLLLRAAMSEARVICDPAGNEKLSKQGQGGRRRNARDDAAAATILAVSEGSRRKLVTSNSGVYLGMV